MNTRCFLSSTAGGKTGARTATSTCLTTSSRIQSCASTSGRLRLPVRGENPGLKEPKPGKTLGVLEEVVVASTVEVGLAATVQGELAATELAETEHLPHLILNPILSVNVCTLV